MGLYLQSSRDTYILVLQYSLVDVSLNTLQTIRDVSHHNPPPEAPERQLSSCLIWIAEIGASRTHPNRPALQD